MPTTTKRRSATAPLAHEEWPFTVELLRLDELFADDRYQRPPIDAFVDKTASGFDETLVGVLDVSRRKDGYAIMDGLQRSCVMRKVAKTTAYCAVYGGMTVADEAMFFYRKNRDRRSLHPFYSFRARIVSGDGVAVKIDHIVREWGFKLHPNARDDDNVAAIVACEDAYSYASVARTESLSSALKTIRQSFYGRAGAKEGDVIRGLARLTQPFYDDEVDWERLYDILEGWGPRTLLGKARETHLYATGKRLTVADNIARDVLKTYNRGFANKLSAQLLHKPN